jgi:hypothetical protein
MVGEPVLLHVALRETLEDMAEQLTRLQGLSPAQSTVLMHVLGIFEALDELVSEVKRLEVGEASWQEDEYVDVE